MSHFIFNHNCERTHDCNKFSLNVEYNPILIEFFDFTQKFINESEKKSFQKLEQDYPFVKQFFPSLLNLVKGENNKPLLNHTMINVMNRDIVENHVDNCDLEAKAVDLSEKKVLDLTGQNLLHSSTIFYDHGGMSIKGVCPDLNDPAIKQNITKYNKAKSYDMIESSLRFFDYDNFFSHRNWIRFGLCEGHVSSITNFSTNTFHQYPRLIEIEYNKVYGNCESKSRCSAEPIRLSFWKDKSQAFLEDFINKDDVITDDYKFYIDCQLEWIPETKSAPLKFSFANKLKLTRRQVLDQLVDVIYDSFYDMKKEKFVFFGKEFHKDAIYIYRLIPNSDTKFTAIFMELPIHEDEETNNNKDEVL